MKNTGNDRKNGGKQINFISENKSIIPCQKSEMEGKIIRFVGRIQREILLVETEEQREGRKVRQLSTSSTADRIQQKHFTQLHK